jgi:hypothetical protein
MADEFDFITEDYGQTGSVVRKKAADIARQKALADEVARKVAADMAAPSGAPYEAPMLDVVASMNPFMAMVGQGNAVRQANRAVDTAQAAQMGPQLPQAVAQAAAPPPPPKVLRQSAGVTSATRPAQPDTALEVPYEQQFAAEQPQQPGVAATGAPGSLQERIAQLIEEQRKVIAEKAAPLYTPEQAAQRQAGSNRALTLGLMGAGAGGLPGIQNVGNQILKQALADQQERVTEHGVYNPITGNFQYLPGYQQARRLESINKELQQHYKTSEEVSAKRDIAEEREATRRMIAAVAAGNAGDKMKLTNTYTSEEGDPIYVVGNQRVAAGKDGTLRPYHGIGIGQTPMDRKTSDAQAIIAADDRLAAIEAKVKANPKAFGGITSLAALTPQIVQSRVLSKTLTPQEQQVRAEVAREMAAVIHQLYGAALSRGEQQLASSFLITGTEPLEALIPKLAAARAYQQGMMNSVGAPFLRAARARRGETADGGAGAPGAGGEEWTVIDGVKVRQKR